MNALLILGLLVTADDTKDATAIQGTWVVESVVDNGKPNQEIKGDRLIIKNGTITVQRQGEEKKATYKLDPGKDPKTIDVSESEPKQEYPGIYRLEGDTLRICVPSQGNGKRPAAFESKPDSGLMLLVLKREKK
jgi:uncharacterized protein (TIGR03067 family)